MSRKIIFLDVDGTLVDYDNRIPESAIQAIRQARGNGHLIYVCTGRSKAEMPQELYAKKKGKTDAEVEHQEVEDVMHGMVFGGELYRDDLNKISFILTSYQDHLDSKEAFPELKAGTWGGRGEEALFGDLGVKDITKAHAIDVLLEHLGAKKEDTIAFGDAKIDIPMLEYCQIGVSMGNGGPEILAMADMVTDDVAEDGLYNAFEKLELL